MKRRIIVIAAFFALAIPTICPAAPARPGPYVSGFVGASVAMDTDVPSSDFITNESFNDRVEFDPNISIGGTGGYDFGIVRLEGELSYKHAGIRSIVDQADGFRFRNVDGDLGALALMANAFVDLHNDTRFTPYAGGGIGFAFLHLSDTLGIDTRGGTASDLLLFGAGDDSVFAYQIGAGVGIALNRQFTLDLGYRYFVTDRANFDSDVLTTSSFKFESHNATIGFRMKF